MKMISTLRAVGSSCKEIAKTFALIRQINDTDAETLARQIERLAADLTGAAEDLRRERSDNL